MEKSSSIFHFKRFGVVNERSAMKVNTDGVLLGAVMTLRPDDRRLLDIGTGTGTIALMVAQRLTDMVCRSFAGAQDDKSDTQDARNVTSSEVESSPLCIDAIDIDEPSATEAAKNFRNSPWPDVLHAHHASLDDFATGLSDEIENQKFDLIFSNPPYFDNALQAPEQRRNAARHTSTGLSYREILDFAAKNLSVNGRVALVLPAETEHDLMRHARMNGLHLYKITRVRTVSRKKPKLVIAEFSRLRTDVPQDVVLTIQSGGQYTQEYLGVTKEFYLFA